MIAIEINDEFLELNDETFRFEKINSAFVTEIYQGDFSFPLTAKSTEKNSRLLGYPNELDCINRPLTLFCYLWVYGVPYCKAVIKIFGGTKNELKFNLSGGLKALTIFDKSLQDLDYGTPFNLGGDPTSIITAAKYISHEFDYSVYGFTFVPHKNEDFYNGNNPDFCGIINRQNPVTGDFYKNTFGTLNKYCLVPFVFLFYVLDTIFKTEELIPSGDFYNDPEMRSILLYNNFSLDLPTLDDNSFLKLTNDYIIFGSSYNYASLQNIKLLNGPTGSFDAAGAWNNTTFQYTIQAPGDITIDANIDAFIDHSIDWHACGVYEIEFVIYANGIIVNSAKIYNSHGLQNVLLSGIFTAILADVGSKILIKYKLGTINYPPYGFDVTIKNTSYLLISNDSEQLNVYSGLVDIKNHIKDMTVSSFLATLKQIGVSIDLDLINKTVQLNYNVTNIKSDNIIDYSNNASSDFELNFQDKDKGFLISYNFDKADKLSENVTKGFLASNYKGKINTIDNLPPPTKLGNIILIANTNQLYVTDFDPSGTGYIWTYFSDNYKDINIANAEQKYLIELTPMFMDYANNEGGTTDENKCIIPTSKQSGSSNMYGIGINDYELKIVFLRGVNSQLGVAVPKGGIYLYASSTNIGINGNKIGNYDLTLDSSSSIYKQFIEDLLIILNKAEYIDIDLLLNELQLLNYNVNVKSIINGICYLTKSLSIDFTNKLKPVRASLIKI